MFIRFSLFGIEIAGLDVFGHDLPTELIEGFEVEEPEDDDEEAPGLYL